MLATIFENYKNRCQDKAARKAENREYHLTELFSVYDTERKGFLTMEETKLFFTILLELTLTREKDLRTFNKCIQLVDEENSGICTKEKVLKLTTSPNFL